MTKHERLLDNYEDALFALLMEKAMEEEGAKLLEENTRLKNDPMAAPSADLDRRCIRTINRAFRKEKLDNAGHIAYRVFRQAAVFILAAALLFTTAFAASETVRVATLNFIVDTFDDHLELRFVEAEEDISNEGIFDFEVGWLPDGFELSDSGTDSSGAWKDYTNSRGDRIGISSVTMDPASVIGIDSENAAVEEVMLNGLAAKIIVKGYIQVIIPVEEYGQVLHILGEGNNLTAEDLIKVAENLKY